MPTPPSDVKQAPWMVIANRAAAAGKVRRQWRHIQRSLDAHLGSYELHFTEHAGHAMELGEQLAAEGHQRFISVGGDGTTHELLTGILRSAAPDGGVTLGIVPMGTGGDFRRILANNATTDDALKAIVSTPARRVDVGHVRYLGHSGEEESRYFLNSTSFGLGGLVDKLVNEMPKVLGGKTSFYLATVRALAKYRSTRVRLELDGVHAGDFDIANVFVTNGRYTGGGMLVAEHSMLNDGLFDVSMVPDKGALWMMRHVSRLYDGTYRQVPAIQWWRAREVRALHLNDRMGLLDIDGENPGRIDATITLVPRAISVPNLRDDVLLPEAAVEGEAGN